MNILAIELSTASAKAMIHSDEGGVLAVKSESFAPEVCDLASQDPEGILEALDRCVRAVVLAYRGEGPAGITPRGQGSGAAEPIAAVGICTTWHSILFLDGKRRPLDRIYTWANADASRSIAKYRRDSELCGAYYQRTGCMANATYPYWQYAHFRDTRPELVAETAYLSSQQEYLFERLTGEAAASLCTASGSGFLNIRELRWDQEGADFLGIGPDRFPPLKEAAYAAPLRREMAEAWGLPTGIPVAIGGADGALNQIGDGALGDGIMTFSIGTSGALRLTTPSVVLPEKPATWCYYLAGGRRAVGGSTSGAGNCLTWFAEKMGMGGKLDLRALDAAAETVDGDRAPLFLPFPYGERCPGWRDERQAAFRDIGSGAGVADLYYAVLEGVLFNLHHCYTILTELMPAPSRILVSGGIVRSPLWLRMAADIFGKDLEVSNVEHVSLLGAAAVARKAIDPGYALDRPPAGGGIVVAPDARNAEKRARRFERYKEFYGAT